MLDDIRNSLLQDPDFAEMASGIQEFLSSDQTLSSFLAHVDGNLLNKVLSHQSAREIRVIWLNWCIENNVAATLAQLYCAVSPDEDVGHLARSYQAMIVAALNLEPSAADQEYYVRRRVDQALQYGSFRVSDLLKYRPIAVMRVLKIRPIE